MCSRILSSLYYVLLLISTVVEVGILPLNSTVSENETFSVCVELTAGSLERNVTVPLLVIPGSASGMVYSMTDYDKSRSINVSFRSYTYSSTTNAWAVIEGEEFKTSLSQITVNLFLQDLLPNWLS